MLLSPGLISLSIAFVLHSDLASFYLHYLSLELVDQIRYLLCASFLLILHLVSDGGYQFDELPEFMAELADGGTYFHKQETLTL